MVADPKLTLAVGGRAGRGHDRRSAGGGRRAHRHAWAQAKAAKVAAAKTQGCERARQHPLHVFALHGGAGGAPAAEGRDHLRRGADELARADPLPAAAAARSVFLQTRGGSLGVGFTGAIGLKLANPDKTVIGFSGDGGSMYTIQALWTAARHNVDAKFVVCNNASYRLLQLNIDAYWKEQGIPKHDYPSRFDLSWPPIRFVDLARGLGVPGARREAGGDRAGRAADARSSGRSWWMWCSRATRIQSGWGPRAGSDVGNEWPVVNG